MLSFNTKRWQSAAFARLSVCDPPKRFNFVNLHFIQIPRRQLVREDRVTCDPRILGSRRVSRYASRRWVWGAEYSVVQLLYKLC